jgi:hypothetical protein
VKRNDWTNEIDCGIAKEILKYTKDKKNAKEKFTEKEIKCLYKDLVQEKDKSESKSSEEIQIVEEVIEEEIVENQPWDLVILQHWIPRSLLERIHSKDVIF